MAEQGARRSLARWFGDRPIRTKVLAPVVLAAVAIGAVSWVGLVAVSQTASQADRLFMHTARPLNDMGVIRDMEGDGRRDVRQYLLATTADDRDSLTKDLAQTDSDLNDAQAAYVADLGPMYDKQRKDLIVQFDAGIANWRKIRDEQLMPAIQRGDRAAALKILNGELTDADESYGAAMDKLADIEQESAKEAATLAEGARNAGRRDLLIAGVIGVAVALGIGLLVARAILRPLRAVGAALDAMADGDLTAEAPVHSADEAGQMAAAFGRARQNTRETLQMLTESAAALSGAADELVSTSRSITETTVRASDQAGNVAAAAGQVTDNIRIAATNSQDMDGAIREIAKTVSDATTVAASSMTAADGARATMARLGESSAEIAAIVKVITSIAEQTNLLALNATIEAARAGEAGKGFAVVAGEVKDLAGETAQATDDISKRVAAIQETTGSAVDAIADISEIIGRINEFQLTIAAAVEEQAATSIEVNNNLSGAAAGSAEIADNIGGIADTAVHTTASVQQINHAAGELAAMSGRLLEAVGTFQL